MMSESFFESFFQRLATWHWGSPSDGDLIAYHDGELTDKQRARIQAHLEKCAQCRERADAISRDWHSLTTLSSAAETTNPIDEAELIADIQASIRGWREANLPHSPAGEKSSTSRAEAERQAIAILEQYVGRKAAKEIIDGIIASQASRQEKLAQAESALRAALGHESAAEVVEKLSRLLDQIPESAG